MIYILAAITAAMLGYILWLTVFRLRHDRVKTQRRLTKGKYTFRPKERVRFLLGRSFKVSEDRPDWEDPLVSSLARVPARPETRPEAASPEPRERR